MKLIIDISEEAFNEVREKEDIDITTLNSFIRAIENGTPLDDVKAEMEKARRFHVGAFDDDNPIDYGIVEGFDKALKILDNIGKAESEEV